MPDVITITAGPSGVPTPVPSGGPVTITFAATDPYDHPLSYAWSASCTGSLGTGAFAPSASVVAPTWTAPTNATGVLQTCTLTVNVNDGKGQSSTAQFTQPVSSLPDTVTITTGPSGTPEPVASAGSVTLALTAEDPIIGHTLSYAWSATCPGLTSTGTFTPSASVRAPVWAAPVNATGAQKTCTLTVVVSDGHGQSATGTWSHRVESLPDVITITTGPTHTPDPVASNSGVTLALAAVDPIIGHTLTYRWTATCPGLPDNGVFSPGANVASPTWKAPVNMTNAQRPCTLTVTIDDGHGQTVVRTLTSRVESVPDVITITSGPTAAPSTVPSGGAVAVAVAATDSLGHPLSYAWSSLCADLSSHGTFNTPTGATATWTAPVNASDTPRSCLLQVTMLDGAGQIQARTVPVTVASPCTFAVTSAVTSLPVLGGPSTVSVATQAGCGWTATSHAAWLTVTGPPSGVGSGAVGYAAAANTAPGPRTGTLTVAGQTVTLTQAGAGYTYYFAEGATIGGFFATRLALLNTDPTAAATVTLDFQLKDTPTVLTHGLSLGPHQRATIDVATLGTVNPALAPLASAEFSTVVRSNVPLVADRTMTWDKSGYGSHAETSIDAPASTWYLAEGATIGDFELYYLIQNPNPTPLTNEIEVTYLLPPPAAPLVRTYSMGPNTRRNIVVHAEPGLENAEVSAIIRTPADKPVIVERAMYLTAGGLFYGAGHESAGIRAPATQWFFAEGATGDFFDLFILIGNPNPTGAQVTATFLFDDGTTCRTRVGSTVENGELVVGPQSRYNIWVDALTIPGCPRSLANAAGLDHHHLEPAGDCRTHHVVAGPDGGQLGRGPQCARRHRHRHPVGPGRRRAGRPAQHRDLRPHRQHRRLRRHRARHPLLRGRHHGGQGPPRHRQQSRHRRRGRRLRRRRPAPALRPHRREPAGRRPARARPARRRTRNVLQRPRRPLLGRRHRRPRHPRAVGERHPRGRRQATTLPALDSSGASAVATASPKAMRANSPSRETCFSQTSNLPRSARQNCGFPRGIVTAALPSDKDALGVSTDRTPGRSSARGASRLLRSAR